MGVITRARTLLVVLASAGLWRCAGGSRALSHSRIRHAVAPASARRSAVLAAEQQPAAEAARSQGKKILIEVEDENIWAAEQLELADMARATATPFALRGYIGSETKDAVFPSTRDVCFHAFERFGEPLEAFDGWPGAGEAGDKARLALITDLLGAVNHLHGRGLPHLCVNEGTVRIGREPLNNELRLRIVGAGAGPSLNAANRTFQVRGALRARERAPAARAHGGGLPRARQLRRASACHRALWRAPAPLTATPTCRRPDARRAPCRCPARGATPRRRCCRESSCRCVRARAPAPPLPCDAARRGAGAACHSGGCGSGEGRARGAWPAQGAAPRRVGSGDTPG